GRIKIVKSRKNLQTSTERSPREALEREDLAGDRALGSGGDVAGILGHYAGRVAGRRRCPLAQSVFDFVRRELDIQPAAGHIEDNRIAVAKSRDRPALGGFRSDMP